MAFMTNSKLFTVLTAVFAVLGISAAWAAKAANLSEEQAAAVQKISAYFNSMQTMQGEFTQISPKGNVSNGIFHISRPGKLRFEYSPPNPFVIISDGTWLTVRNKAKNRADQYPLSKTPLRLMLAARIDLLNEAVIKNVDTRENLTTVTLEDRDQLVPGHLILVYNNEKNALQQWVVVDGKGRRTTVSLTKIVPDVKADPKLFVFKRKNRVKAKADR